MGNKRQVITVLIAIVLATIVGTTIHQNSTTPTNSETWHRYSDGAWGEHINSEISYLYVPMTMAGVIEKIEPTPGNLLSNIRQTEVYYYADSNGILCHTYISWDTDLGPGDHITLSVIYKYQVDENLKDGLEPTVLVDREVIDFRVVKEGGNSD